MMRSMYSGVSGLRNHQTRMDVIGNNIANINTAGYKKSRVVFQDTLYQTMRGATRPDSSGSRGGTNPMGIGLGMSVSSIDQIHTGAPTTATNKLLDMGIDGDGYFMIRHGQQKYFTRAGNFELDTKGNLVHTANGYYVQGWVTKIDPVTGQWNLDCSREVETVDISGLLACDPQATKEMSFSGNLDAEIPFKQVDPEDESIYPGTQESIITSMDVWDSLGKKETVYFRFFKYEVEAGPPRLSNWAVDVSLNNPMFENAKDYDSTSDFSTVDLSVDPPAGETLTTGETEIVRLFNLQFDDNGKVVLAGTPDDPEPKTVDLVIDRASEAAEDIEFKIDFSAMTQFAGNSVTEIAQNGYGMGSLSSYTVGIDGVIRGSYDNGETRDLARVALARFQNPAGLTQLGGTMFQKSVNSGEAVVSPPTESGMGKIVPSSLEMSNVDLSEEFTDMIVTQRGFQANSRIITTSDEMIQELVNLKR